MIEVLVHLIDGEPILGQLHRAPDPYARAVVVHSPRRRDGKSLPCFDPLVTQVIWSWSAIRYIEILPRVDEERLIS